MFSSSSEIEDYYEILGCDENSSHSQIVSEYRYKSRLYHPDKQKDDSTREMLYKIQKAYAVIGDESERKRYDLYRSQGLDISYEDWKDLKAPPITHWYNPKKQPNLLTEKNSENNLYESQDDLIKKFRRYEI